MLGGGGGGGQVRDNQLLRPLPLSKEQRGENTSCGRCVETRQADSDDSLCPKHPFLICVTMPALMAPDLQKVPGAKPI